MSRGDVAYDAPTRRDYIKYAGAVVGGGLFAGCAEQSDSGATPTETETATSTSYEVCTEPTGCVTFKSPPETWVSPDLKYIDMGVALGMYDKLVGIGEPKDIEGYAGEYWNTLSGVDIQVGDREPVTNTGSGPPAPLKEVYYALDADVHLMDPNNLRRRLDEEDVQDLLEIGPFIGNSNRHPYRRDDAWGEYAFYDLYTDFEKTAQVFQRVERFEAFQAVHDEMQTRIDERLGTDIEPKEVGVFAGGSNPTKGEFQLRDPTIGGLETKQFRSLSVRDGMLSVDQTTQNPIVDYEALLRDDPEIIVIQWDIAVTQEEFNTQFREPMGQDTSGGELTAVQNGDIYLTGQEQGPITHLFQTERLAQQLYPDTFGGTDLFDHQRVADIINGNL